MGFRTVRGTTAHPADSGYVWLQTHLKLYNPSPAQALNVESIHWSVSTFGVDAFSLSYGDRTLVPHELPIIAYVPPRHSVSGYMAFEVFRGDRKPVLSVTVHDALFDLNSFTWKLHQ